MEFNAGLQTRQEERYVILLFLLLLGGSFTSFSWHLRWSVVIHPLTVKYRPCALIWACALNRKNTVHIDVCKYRNLHVYIFQYTHLIDIFHDHVFFYGYCGLPCLKLFLCISVSISAGTRPKNMNSSARQN